MHFGDYTFIFLLALVLFGPKKLPDMARQLGKLLAEFRRASNEFKFQIQEELRNMEDEERRKKLAESQALSAASTSAMAAALPATAEGTAPSSTAEVAPTILPPSTGITVSAAKPFATPVVEATDEVVSAVPESPEEAVPVTTEEIATTEMVRTPKLAGSNGTQPEAKEATAETEPVPAGETTGGSGEHG
ncbi:MAG: twin-arginine translocase TatA/TatE family subunit [Acidobacteriaceae bacterium]